MLLLNGQTVTPTIFPDKTSQVWKIPDSTFVSDKAVVDWIFSSEAEFIHLAQLQDLLCSRGIRTTLNISYLPYARQDKNVANDATFALHTFLKLMNTLNFHKITVNDPHNADAVRFNCQMEYNYPRRLVEQVAQEMDKNGAFTIFCYPDKGALTKYSEVYKLSHRAYIYGEKVREQSTGNILSYKVLGGGCKGNNVLIVDDICDGGMTFRLLAKDLLAAGAKEVNLFVTHGLFTKGLKVLKDAGINRIFCQDGECFEDHHGGRWTEKL